MTKSPTARTTRVTSRVILFVTGLGYDTGMECDVELATKWPSPPQERGSNTFIPYGPIATPKLVPRMTSPMKS